MGQFFCYENLQKIADKSIAGKQPLAFSALIISLFQSIMKNIGGI
jgi:hypothetical protein